MTWVRFEDNFFNNPKVAPLSNAAFRLYIQSIAYSNQFLTDGKLAENNLRSFSVNCRARKKHVNELLSAGLWQKEGDVWSINDYLEYQPSANEVREISEKRAKAGRAGGKANRKQDALTKKKPKPNQPKPNQTKPKKPIIDSSNLIEKLSDLEALGFELMGQMSSNAQTKLMRHLPIAEWEWNAAINDPNARGKPWAYVAKIIESMREESAKGKAAPVGNKPKRDPKIGYHEGSDPSEFTDSYVRGEDLKL